MYGLLAYAVVLKHWQAEDLPKAKRRGHNIGAVLVDETGKLAAWARNCRYATKNATQHAEVRLIQGYLASNERSYLNGCTIYTTLEPCAQCSGMMVLTNARRAVYGQTDLLYGKAMERLKLDSTPIGGYQPYPRPVVTEANSGAMRAKIDASFKRWMKDSKSDDIIAYLRSETAKALYEEADLRLREFEVRHEENSPIKVAILAFLEEVPAQYVSLTESDGSTPFDGTLRVGVILPMTGVLASYGEECWNGMQFALADLEAALPEVTVSGGGKKRLAFHVMLRDEASSKQQAANHARSLIEDDHAHVLLGSVASSHTKTIFQEAGKHRVPCVSPVSTHDALTTIGAPYTSCVCYKDAFQGVLLARFALAQGWKKAAVVLDASQDYAVGLGKQFEAAYRAGGGSSSSHTYVTQAADFSILVKSVASDVADVIFIAGYYPEAAQMIRQSKDTWSGVPIIGSDGLDSPVLVALVRELGVEVYLTSHFAADAPTPRVRDFVQRYEARHGREPGVMAALGYDTLLVLVDAVARAGDPADGEDLARAIAGTRGVAGVTGTISLDNDERTPEKDAAIVRIDRAGMRFFSTVRGDR